jgi:hypothetical protein
MELLQSSLLAPQKAMTWKRRDERNEWHGFININDKLTDAMMKIDMN